MRRILVTGANGQLGNAMRLLGATSRNEYRFTDVAELDITDVEAVRRGEIIRRDVPEREQKNEMTMQL